MIDYVICEFLRDGGIINKGHIDCKSFNQGNLSFLEPWSEKCLKGTETLSVFSFLFSTCNSHSHILIHTFIIMTRIELQLMIIFIIHYFADYFLN